MGLCGVWVGGLGGLGILKFERNEIWFDPTSVYSIAHSFHACLTMSEHLILPVWPLDFGSSCCKTGVLLSSAVALNTGL